MKIAITGKGGVGKTTLAAGLSLLFSQEKKKVIALDCDPDMSLGFSLGFPHLERIKPISELKDLIAQRSGVQSLDKPSPFFKLNPKVDDIPEKFCPEYQGIRLIVIGKVLKSAGGCLCPENAFMRTLISHLVLRKDEVVIMDMPAGSEHLGRATAKNVDCFLIVVEPNNLAVNSALHIKELALDLGIKRILFVGNRIKESADRDFLKKIFKDGIISFISFNTSLEKEKGRFIFDEKLKKEIDTLLGGIKNG